VNRLFVENQERLMNLYLKVFHQHPSEPHCLKKPKVDSEPFKTRNQSPGSESKDRSNPRYSNESFPMKKTTS